MKRVHTKSTKAKKKKSRANKKPTTKGQFLISYIAKTINQFFPDLWQRVDELQDSRRKQGKYSLSEIVAASVMMFIFQRGSRNGTNEIRLEGDFKKTILSCLV